MRAHLSYFLCLTFGARLIGATESTTVEQLSSYLTGNYVIADEARYDQNLRDITLHITPVWRDRSDGPWLYFEQALAVAPEHPYKQQFYQLATSSDGALELQIYDLTDPIAATGAWKDPSRLDTLGPAGLVNRKSCMVILRLQPDGSFKGGSENNGCPSALADTDHVSSEFIVSSTRTIIWDRGYNASGVQIWGPLGGGYIFKKVE